MTDRLLYADLHWMIRNVKELGAAGAAALFERVENQALSLRPQNYKVSTLATKTQRKIFCLTHIKKCKINGAARTVTCL